MELDDMSAQDRRRAIRFIRERKHYRLTKFTISKLEELSRLYQTSETAIVEAGIHKLFDCHQLKHLDSVLSGKKQNINLGVPSHG